MRCIIIERVTRDAATALNPLPCRRLCTRLSEQSSPQCLAHVNVRLEPRAGQFVLRLVQKCQKLILVTFCRKRLRECAVGDLDISNLLVNQCDNCIRCTCAPERLDQLLPASDVLLGTL
jgi:hypothetical protein